MDGEGGYKRVYMKKKRQTMAAGTGISAAVVISISIHSHAQHSIFTQRHMTV